MTNDVPTSKVQIRREILAQRRALSAKEAAVRSMLVRERLLELPEFRTADLVLTYISAKDNEVDTLTIVEQLLREGRRVACPSASPVRELVWRQITSLDDLCPGAYGIPKPDPSRCEIISPDENTVALIPAIAFDKSCHRIGYGGGYFDVFLPAYKGVSIGLAYDFQVMDRVPVEPHDEPLDMVVTETTMFHNTNYTASPAATADDQAH